MKKWLKWGVATTLVSSVALATPVLRPLWAAKSAREVDEIGARVEMMDALPAAKIARGLGFNVNLNNAGELAQAKEVGASEARMQFDWPSVEVSSGQLQLPPAMALALDGCAQNGLEPLIIAAYAPNAPALGVVTVAADVPAGATQIPVSGAILPRIDPPRCHVLRDDGTQIVAEGRWAYYGALIDSVEGQTLQLAAKTSLALPQGTKLRVNQLLYPSVATTDPQDPSLVAYGRYARFLAAQIASRGLKGRVELWNEPPWVHDKWDSRAGFYDVPPRDLSAQSPNPGMLDEFLNGPPPPSGVSFVWGGSNKSGGRGLGARRGVLSAAQLQNVSADAIHPYGDAPETHAWSPQALRNGARGEDLALVGTNLGSNFKVLRQNQVAARGRGDLAPRIVASEIGYQGANTAQQTRYDLRAFLLYLSLGLDRVNFYRLADKPGGFGFIDASTQTPRPVFRAFKNLMAEINVLPRALVSFDVEDVPSIESYRGTIPLTVIPIRAPGRWLMVSYQRTFAAPPQKWKDVPSPAPASVEMRLPAGYRVQKAWNLVTMAPVEFQIERGSVSFAVSDDPIGVEMSTP